MPDPLRRSYAVTIDVTVVDEDALQIAARDRAEKDGVLASWLEDEHTIEDCLVMLFDPGESPPGCQIDSSCAEQTGNLLSRSEPTDD